MATVTAFQGNVFVDCVLNGSGDASNWSDFLTENNLDEWCPILVNGQVFQIPSSANINATIVSNLAIYPANNSYDKNIYEQIDTIFGILATASTGIVPNFQHPIIDTNTYYFVREGEQISDIIENSTGDITNWSDILNANNFDWDELLYSGQKITIPNSVIMNLNNFRGLNVYPANNNSVPDIYIQISAIFEQLINPVPSDWILANPNGEWNDISHFWRDFAFWIDN